MQSGRLKNLASFVIPTKAGIQRGKGDVIASEAWQSLT